MRRRSAGGAASDDGRRAPATLPDLRATGASVNQMKKLETRLDGPALIAPDVLGDERGFFVETYRRNEFAELGIAEEMVQDNHSRSKHGIVRGMHFQIGEGAAKLVRCGRGDDRRRGRRPAPRLADVRRVGGVRADRRERAGWSTARSASRTASAWSRELADVFYKQSQLLRRRARARHQVRRPRRRDRVAARRSAELIPSERDANAPTLARDRGRAAVRATTGQSGRLARARRGHVVVERLAPGAQLGQARARRRAGARARR